MQTFDDAWKDAMYNCYNGNHNPFMPQKYDVEYVDSGKLIWKTQELEIQNLKLNSKTSKHPCLQFFNFWFPQYCWKKVSVWGFHFWFEVFKPFSTFD